jgi:hypothetical protein
LSPVLDAAASPVVEDIVVALAVPPLTAVDWAIAQGSADIDSEAASSADMLSFT